MNISVKQLKEYFRKKKVLDPTALPRGSTSGGKRVNGRPLVIGISLILIVLGCIVYTAHLRSQNKIDPLNRPQSSVQKEGRSALQMANEAVADFWQSPEIPREPAATTKSKEDKPTAPTNAGDQSDNRKTVDFGDADIADDPFREERMRVQERRLQALEAALTSKMGVQISELRNRQTSSDVNDQIREARKRLASMNDTTASYQSRLAQMQGATSGMDTLYRSTSASRNDVHQFEKAEPWKLDSRVDSPDSPFIIRAGFVIPATMISGINSDLPGQVMAQVSQNVFDSATGRYLLIPQGTRLIGAYGSDVGYGQKRIFMAWQRLVFPDGKTLDIRAMPGADSAGYAGFNDKVNNHWFRTISSAILMSGVIAAIDLSQDDGSSSSDSDRQRAGDALSEALGQTLGQTLGQIISKNLNVAPTLEIRPGYRFNVMVTRDLTLPGVYQAFDY